MPKFIQSDYIANSIIGDAEKSAIIIETFEEHPEAEHVEVVDGGVMVFESMDEYYTWEAQT